MNDHNIEIGIAGVGLLIGLCGVFFQTRHEGKKGIASITKWGWLLAVLLVLATCGGVYNLIQARKASDVALSAERDEKNKLQAQLDDANALQQKILSKTQDGVEQLIQRGGIPEDSFLITIETGKIHPKNAGTDATVSIRLHGKSGVSQWLRLNGPGNDFEEGAIDRFLMSTIPLGEELERVELKRTKGEKDDAGWMFKRLEVSDRKRSGRVYRVAVPKDGMWLHTNEKMGGLHRDEKLVPK